MLVPDVSLLDPETLTTMSAELSACTGLDALTHAIEAYVSNAHFELADTMALEAIDRVAVFAALYCTTAAGGVAQRYDAGKPDGRAGFFQCYLRRCACYGA